jgi:hypothetical protein
MRGRHVVGRTVGATWARFSRSGHAYLHARTLLLERANDRRVAIRPASRDALRHLLLAQRAETHRHVVGLSQVERQAEVLPREPE